MNPKPETQLAVTPEPSIGVMLQGFLANPEAIKNVEVAERMFALFERSEARRAEREFSAAFVALQKDLPVFVAKSIIPNRGKYERYEDLMELLSPILTRNGFTTSFTMDVKENRVIETFHLRHVGGHSQSNSFAVRTGGRADSDTQADCKASTTAKRYALINGLNLVIRQDASLNEGDLSLEGAFISFDKAAYLKERVKETGADVARFLKAAGAESFETIGENRYDSLLAQLDRKAGKGSAA
jgi:hypothetical protein